MWDLTKKYLPHCRLSHVSTVHQDNQAIHTCKLEQQPSIPSTVTSIFFLLAVTFLLGDKYGSDRHPTGRASSPKARWNQHAEGVSPLKRGIWIQAACKHISMEGRQGRRRFTSVQWEKTSSLRPDLEGKDRYMCNAVVWPWRLAHLGF